MIATKEQELKAVEKIRKIVESLGTDSYVGTAMEGVLEIAEENIQNDFACSMKNRAELAERELKNTSSRFLEKSMNCRIPLNICRLKRKDCRRLIHGFLTSWKKKRSGRPTEGVRWKGTRNSQGQLYQDFWTMNTVKSSFTAFMVSQRKKLQS